MPGLLIQSTNTNTSCKRDCISKMISPSPPPSSRPTIHSRRTLSSTLRREGSQSPPPALSGLGISNIGISTPISNPPMTVKGDEIFEIPERGESDKECWSRMLKLQRTFHCYNSARLEAAVEALEMGWGEDAVRMPSRLCLDLLNEQLREKMRIWSEL